MLTSSSFGNQNNDKSKLLTFHSAPCINCQEKEFKKVFDSYDFDTGTKAFSLIECTNCHLTRCSPILEQSDLGSYYDTKYYGASNRKFNPVIESLTIWHNRHLARKILKTISSCPASKKDKIQILDIGCGRANLLQALKRHGCNCFGVERPDFPYDVEPEGITILKGDFLDLDFQNNQFDAIVIWHVLEHLTEPIKTLRKAEHLLKPGGTLIVAVPNFASLQRTIFGKHWFHLDLPRHTYHFSFRTLQPILRNFGLTLTSIETHCFDQSIFGFIQSTINLVSRSKPNTLYSLLKSSSLRKRDIFAFSTQLLLAVLITPLAFLEYLLSGAIGKGSCIEIMAKKNNVSRT